MNKRGKGKLTTIFGGQFGSEGKGQIAHHIASTDETQLAVRIGGPNAGHTFYNEDQKTHDFYKVVVQQVPCPVYSGARAVIGPEGVINPKVLARELKQYYERMGHYLTVYIDSNASVVQQRHLTSEEHLDKAIGSTREGVGACTADKVMRNGRLVVKDLNPDFLGLDIQKEESLKGVAWGIDTAMLVNHGLRGGQHVIIEGTQGFGLGLHLSGHYPYCTSRECTPNALWAGTGINPRNASYSESIMVLRTFPIRVGGHSGPMEDEITWEYLEKRSGGYIQPEVTTVTQRIRRISKFDYDQVKRAILITRPDYLALSFVDYQFPEIANLTNDGLARFLKKHEEFKDWLVSFQQILGVPIKYLSTGPGSTSTIKIQEGV